MAYNQVSSVTDLWPLIGTGTLEKSITACEELLASMQTAMHPSAERTKYLLRVRLAKIRQQLKDIRCSNNGA
jgi:hypothetical protein